MTTTTTPTIRDQIAAALPANAHAANIPFGLNATWTTPGATWNLSYLNIPIATAFGLTGHGLHVKVDVRVANPDIDTILATLRLHGAITAAPDPTATVRQLAQELTTIDRCLIDAGVARSGAQGVIALATAYRDRIQADEDRGEGQLDDARVLLAEAAKLLAANCNPASFTPPGWFAEAEKWLELHEAYFAGAPLPHYETAEDHADAAALTAHEDADPGRPEGMMPATGGLVTSGPLVGSAGCVIDIQEPSRFINPDYRAVIQHELDQAKPIRH